LHLALVPYRIHHISTELEYDITPAKLLDAMIDALKSNIEENSDFSAILLKRRINDRRSNRIRKAFVDGLKQQVVYRLRKFFEFAFSIGILNIP
jgi:hypothetical protein